MTGARTPSAPTTAGAASPFERWIDYKLRQIYDPILDEPIPSHLLELVERHRRKQGDGEE